MNNTLLLMEIDDDMYLVLFSSSSFFFNYYYYWYILVVLLLLNQLGKGVTKVWGCCGAFVRSGRRCAPQASRRDSMQQDGARLGERLHLAQSCTALLENAARRALLVK